MINPSCRYLASSNLAAVAIFAEAAAKVCVVGIDPPQLIEIEETLRLNSELWKGASALDCATTEPINQPAAKGHRRHQNEPFYMRIPPKKRGHKRR